MRADLARVLGCLMQVRALRVRRAALEYPVGHPERARLPRFVAEWEEIHGAAIASTDLFLNTGGTGE